MAHDSETEKTLEEQAEEVNRNLRYSLATNINERQEFLLSLIRRLATSQDDKPRTDVLVEMLIEEYERATQLVLEFKELGGDYYSIDRGLWRRVFER